MKKIYPSSMAFNLEHFGVVTKYSSGCLRYAIAKLMGLKVDIKPIYGELGDFDEARVYKKLLDSGKYSMILDETPFKYAVSDDIVISGRTDFLVWKEGDTKPTVIEKKGTMSKSGIYDLRKGNYNVGHLAQIVTYMLCLDLEKGFLIVNGYRLPYKREDPATTPKFTPTVARKTGKEDEFIFKVELKEGGAIYVNGEDCSFNAADIVRHIKALTTIVTNEKPDVLPERPESRDPCFFCDMKAVCEKEPTRQEFNEGAEEVIKNQLTQRLIKKIEI